MSLGFIMGFLETDGFDPEEPDVVSANPVLRSRTDPSLFANMRKYPP
jgi:hypothetical protein